MKLLTILAASAVLGMTNANAQEIPANVKVIKYEQLFEMVNQPTDQLIAVNFWATWCAPCVQEIPHFVEVAEKFKDNPNFKMVFVSMDRAKQLDRVIQFVADKGIVSEVVLLDDNKRSNEWMPRIDKSWSSNIPVTVFYQNGEKVHFVGSEMSAEELQSNIQAYIKE